MSKASAGTATRPRQSTDSSRQGRSDQAGNYDSFLVLIRLPALAEASQAAASPAPDRRSPESGPAAAVSTVTATSSAASGGIESETPRASAAEPAWASSRSREPNAWSRYQVARLLGQVAAAALMVGLFVAAYLLLSGGRNLTPGENGGAPETAGKDPGQTNGAVKTDGEKQDLPEPPSADSEDSRKPADEGAGSKSEPAAVLPPAPQLTDVTPKAQDPADKPPPAGSTGNLPLDPSGVREPGPDRASRDANPLARDTKSPDNPPAGGQWPPLVGPRTQPAPGPDARRQEPTDGARFPYPVTDPGTYKYPVNYHEQLQAQPGLRASEGAPAGTNGGAGSYQLPSTARLQPRMDPPPMR